MVLPLISGSPGVYIREEDDSGLTLGLPTSVGCIVFPAKQGSLLPRVKTSKASFTQEYGFSDVAWGFGHISAKAFLEQGNQLWCLRVPGDGAKYAGASVFYNVANPTGPYSTANVYQSLGTSSGFDADGGFQLQNTLLSRALIAGSSVSGSVSANGNTVNITPIGFSTDQPTTLAALTASINAALANLTTLLNTQINGQSALNPPSATLIDPNNGVIAIVSPENAPLVATFTVANNGNPTTLQVFNSNLIDIFAENPGAWGNNLAFNITNIDPGVFQRTAFTFSGPLSVGNSVTINLIYNGNVIKVGPYVVPNGQSSAQAMANITGLINTALNASSAATLSNNTLVINIVSPLDGPNMVGMQNFICSGGSNAPVIYFSETLRGIESTGQFTLNIYQRGNLRIPLGSYTGTLTPGTNGFQDQTFLEDVVNNNANKSLSVRVTVNKALVAAGMFIDPNLAAQFAQITFLSGGNDGNLPSNAEIANAWSIFADKERYRMNILINGGFTNAAIQQTISNLADTRRDCIAIIDVPAAYQAVQDCYNWRTQVSNINTSFASICSPDILILDTDTNQQVFAPRSGFDAARYVYTDTNFAVWNAPAGYDRGRLPDALAFRYDYAKADRDILDAVQINCGKHALDGSGLVIFAENTSQVTPSLLSSVAVRRNMTFMENSIAYSVERNMFDQNSAQLGFLIRKKIEAFLQPIQDGGGIKRFKVVCSPSNNPGIFADAGQLNVSVYITPIRPVRIILLNAVIVPSGISFDELIVSGSI